MGVVTSTFRVVYQSGHVSKLGAHGWIGDRPIISLAFGICWGNAFSTYIWKEKQMSMFPFKKLQKCFWSFRMPSVFPPYPGRTKTPLYLLITRGEWASYHDKCHGRGGSRRIGGMWDGRIGRTWGELVREFAINPPGGRLAFLIFYCVFC